jgi:hypothetical protein
LIVAFDEWRHDGPGHVQPRCRIEACCLDSARR